MGNESQSPSNSADMLRQVLSQPNACIGFLIGAGCPASIRVPNGDGDPEPLIPAIDALTEQVRETIEPDLSTHLETIYGWLVAQHTKQKKNDSPNVEEILSRIRLEIEVVRDDSVINEATLIKLENEVCSMVRDAVKRDLPDRSSPFHSLAHWVKHLRSASPVEVFTTNYDLLLEQAFEDTATPYFDGFIGGRKAFFDVDSFEASDLPTSWTKLWKLHGSINWRQYINNQIVRTSADDSNANLIIYPSYMKYSETQKLPFTAMFDKFKEFLRQKSCFLIVLGYSYRDAHINAMFDGSLARNPGLKIISLQFSELGDYPNAVEMSLQHGNLIVMARDKYISGRKEYPWKADDLVGTPLDNGAGKARAAQPTPTFTLGDFMELGKFIDEFVGVASRRVSETPQDEQEGEQDEKQS